MSTVEEEFVYTTINESIMEKDWAAGSRDPITQMDFVCGDNRKGRLAEVKYAPALWKIIDETIVNALDHKIRCEMSTIVTEIKVSIDRSGRIRVYNDGKGISTKIHQVASEKLGVTTHVPTLIFGTLFQGSNRKPSPDSIIGGTNGLGAKLSVIFSVEFAMETCNDTEFFIQKWSDHMKIAHPPRIIPLNSPQAKGLGIRAKQHTLISFLPDYTMFGISEFNDAAYEMLSGLIRARVIFASVYAGIPVWFNDEKYLCTVKDLATIFFPGEPIVVTTITPIITKHPHHKFPWNICAVIGRSGCAGNVNGVMVRDGKHYNYLRTRVCNDVRDEVAKILKDKDVSLGPSVVNNNVFLFVNAKIPQVHWTGQRKDVVEIDQKKLAGYQLPAAFSTEIASKMKEILVAGAKSSKLKIGAFDSESYYKAKYAGSRRWRETSLIFVEGKSALTQLIIGIAKSLGWDFYGAMCLGGVILNVRKECIITRIGGRKYVKMSDMMKKNVFWNAFIALVGLVPEYDYDPKSTTYEKELNGLNYGCLIAMVDQDFDGKGQILGLIMNAIEYLWPNLITFGFLKWYCTPIIRAYPKSKGKILEFYSIDDYNVWEATGMNRHVIRYYKGIATHDRDEVIHMFQHFRDHVYTYYLDDRSAKLFDIYFGNNPDARKVELSMVTKVPTDIQYAHMEATKTISCSHHLEYETNLYQKDNIERKLDSVIDGQNQAGRKILDGIIKLMSGGGTRKVNQLAGYISEHGNYHHGEVGLGDSVAGRAFITCGGKQIPLLLPKSQFGSRLGGGDDCGATRYIYCILNRQVTDLLFPAIDYGLYDFNFDGDDRCEPKHFIPILPLCILESTELPGTGWKLKTWARDVFKVIDAVNLMIKYGDIKLAPLPPTTYVGTPYAWKGTFRIYRGERYSIGKYQYVSSTRTLIITELPLRVWTSKYIANLRKQAKKDERIILPGGSSINSRSDDMSVFIEIKLTENAINLLDTMGDSSFTDGVEEYFHLRELMDTHLNLTECGKVIPLKSYEEAMKIWFKYRRDHYVLRIGRISIMHEMNIVRLENIIKFIKAGFKFSMKKCEEMETILCDAGYPRLWAERISSPKFIRNDRLKDEILNGKKASYSYLLDLSDLKKSSENLAKLEAELNCAHIEFSNHNSISTEGSFPGAAIWLNELSSLESKLREGMETFWKYGDVNKHSF